MIKTACPLDCFDACSVVCDSNSLKMVGSKDLPLTNGTLCAHLYKHIGIVKRLTTPMVNGVEVSMDEALDAVAKAIKDKPWILWRGSGNLGLMQDVTNILAKVLDGATTKGTLCDGAGDAAIVDGRGVNRLLSAQQIKKADVVIVWGRNLTETNPHLVPFIKDKKIVVIDPRVTKIAKMANLHIQVKPRSDFYLATILARFLIMEGSEDREWLDEYASEWDDFYDFTRGFRIKAILEYIGLSLDEIGDLLLMLQKKRVVFLIGAGVQRYEVGYDAVRAIDSLAAILGMFGKEGCGVSYLSNSRLGFKSPFEVNLKQEQKATTPFSNYKSVIVQGGNPAESMPCSNIVKEQLKGVENLVYFGLYDNDTSKLANIIIPAKNFLEKDDIRLSYGHEYMQRMNKVTDCSFGISEYEFTQEILKRLNLELLESEEFYIEFWQKQALKRDSGFVSPAFEDVPYRDGFGEDGDDEFEFVDDFYDDFEEVKALTRFRKKVKSDKSSYYLLTPKSHKVLNTQFNTLDNEVFLNLSLGFKDGDSVSVSSQWGELILKVRLDSNLRDDTVVIYHGVKGVNVLTPAKVSSDGDVACYGDVKVIIEKIN